MQVLSLQRAWWIGGLPCCSSKAGRSLALGDAYEEGSPHKPAEKQCDASLCYYWLLTLTFLSRSVLRVGREVEGLVLDKFSAQQAVGIRICV